MKTAIFCIVTFFGVLQGNLWGSPKVVAKFGQSQCPWSEQLKQEVWNSSTFQALLDSAGIEREEKESSEKDQNVPILILLSSSGEEIGSVGYLMISPEKYIDLLKEMLSIHSLCQTLDPLNAQQLLQLYRKSQVLHMAACEEKLLQEGLKKDSGVDFLIEHYAKVIKNHPRKAQKIKEEIRARKPEDPATEWELALLSFQSRREKMKEEEKIVLPLAKFLRDYGTKDQDYAWRCHLVLAEFYRDKNRLDKARHHAKLAAEGAPLELKGMINDIGNAAL
ncbi:MAG: hypothetical protein KBA81_00225 [Rhabdochlamydiaceae bacterium]|nr:hypothetical protein [Rhabdochlamydiaceae bacterium]